MNADLAKQKPLFAFSVYIQIHADCLLTVGQEICHVLDASFSEEGFDGREFNRTYGLIWLWVLGAYEVIRTMDAASSCFSAELSTRISRYKKNIAKLRIPFSKQEKRGRKVYVDAEPSVSSMDCRQKDMGFSVNGDVIYSRDLYGQFHQLIHGITPQQIIQRLEDTYGEKTSNTTSSRSAGDSIGGRPM